MAESEEMSPGGTPDQYQEYKVYSKQYPTPHEALFRMAIDRVLTPLQKEIWGYWNYDKLTQKEIGVKTKKSQQAIEQQIRTIEKHLAEWCKEHLEIFKLLLELEHKD